MAVHPVSFDNDGSVVVLICDACGYVGDQDVKKIEFVRTLDDVLDFRYLVLSCPQCARASTHPVSGGCDPYNVQKLFAYALYRHDEHPAKTFHNGIKYVHDMVMTMETASRFALGGIAKQP